MRNLGFSVFTLLIGIAALAAAMFVFPQWNVWRADLEGQAALRRAENERKVQIKDAEARAESAVLLAKAEVERAKGVAEANRIIADGLGGPQGYLRYLWITKLGENDQDVIYIPTEAGIPILEAGREVLPR